MCTRTFVVAVFFLACAGSAGAQNLTLEFRDGRVSIDATNTPVRTILSEWARLGGTRVVGSERVAGAPLTIHLENVPEAQALEIVLRNVAGYMAAPRTASSAGASLYDRILVLATSSAPAAAANTRGAQNPPNAARNSRAPGNPQPADSDDPFATQPAAPPPDMADTGVNDPPFQFPQQNPFQAAQPGQPGPFGTPMPANGQPPVIQFGQPAGQGVSINPAPAQPTPILQFPGAPPSGTTTAPGGFGIGSPMPGVIVQPPQPQPGQPVRPPGGN
jgi:hypothetical protein